MKKTILMIAFFCMIFCLNSNAQENLILENYRQMGIDNVFENAENALPEFDGESIVANLSLGKSVDYSDMLDTIKEYALKSFHDMVKVFMLIVVTGYVISVTNITGGAFGGATSKNAFIIGYCVFAGILVSVFVDLIVPARETIEILVTMVKSTIPVILTLLTLSGGVTTSGFISPLLISLVNVVASVIGEFLISVSIATVSLSVADRMSEHINISSAVKTLKQFVKWVLLFCMAVYSGIYGVYGFTGSALDSRLGKATRFAVGSSVPVVGGVVSDSIETIIGTIAALRSITGVVGIIAICVVAITPLIKIAMVMWMLRLSAVVIEPVSDIKLVQLTSDIADSVSMIFAILTAVSLLFVGCIGIILLSGNFIS